MADQSQASDNRRAVRLIRWHPAAITAAALLWCLLPALASAGLDVEAGADPAFRTKVVATLAALERCEDAVIRRLHAAVLAAPAAITVRQITEDPATWHADGDRDRGHTDPADGRPKGKGRSTSTGAIVYIPVSAVQPGNPRWKSGLFVHELMHAVDLAYGRYHPDYTVRERRAVFVQNVWRARLGAALRATYHGRFPTVDYQEAARRMTLDAYVRALFAGADFPPPSWEQRDPPRGAPGTSSRPDRR